jgi:hypothetical protein
MIVMSSICKRNVRCSLAGSQYISQVTLLQHKFTSAYYHAVERTRIVLGTKEVIQNTLTHPVGAGPTSM